MNHFIATFNLETHTMSNLETLSDVAASAYNTDAYIDHCNGHMTGAFLVEAANPKHAIVKAEGVMKSYMAHMKNAFVNLAKLADNTPKAAKITTIDDLRALFATLQAPASNTAESLESFADLAAMCSRRARKLAKALTNSAQETATPAE